LNVQADKRKERAPINQKKESHQKEGRRTQTERRATSEQNILRAAIRIIGEKGIVRITLAEVGAAAGYSRGLPAHLFGTKEALLVRVVESFFDGPWGYVLPPQEPGCGIEGVFELLKHWFEGSAKYPEYVRTYQILMGEASCKMANEISSDLREVILRTDSYASTRFYNYLIESKAKGEIRKDIDPKQYSFMIAGGARGIIGQWILNPDAFDIKQVGKDYIDSLRRALVVEQS
jgi:AcrR family transcriptional regulator